MKIKCFFVAAFLVLITMNMSALQADLSVGLNARNSDATGVFPQLDIAAAHKMLGLGFFFNIYATTDGLYPSPESQFGSLYILVKEGGISYDNGAIHLIGGRFVQKDSSDSPYSLFFSSNKNSALGLSMAYDDGVFFYESRWVQLNYNSAIYKQDYPVTNGTNSVTVPFDRGLNYRTIGFHIGDFKLAYLESCVYTGRSFDYEYFLVPIPGYFTQYIRSASGSPWQESKPWGAAADDGFIVGLSLDYQHDAWYGTFQWLVDDIDLNAIIKPDGPQNPNKWAFNTGARYKSDIGTFGLFGAMAYEYTFQPIGGGTYNSRYGYTYYPDVQSGGHAIPQTDNNIGYINGENNLAFMLQYQNDFSGFRVDSSLEFVLTGSQSPANPWSSHTDWQQGGQGSHWLGDPVLEKKLRLKGTVAYDLKPFTFELSFMLGYVWNALQLVDSGETPVNTASGEGLQLYRPSSTSRFIGSVTITAILHLREAPKPAASTVEPAKTEAAKTEGKTEADTKE